MRTHGTFILAALIAFACTRFVATAEQQPNPTANQAGRDVPQGFGTYIVQPGDTLYSIAKRSGSTVDDLARVNRLKDPAKIRAGQVLWVPKGVPSMSTELDAMDVTDTPSDEALERLGVTQQEFDLLARLIRAEAGGEPLEGQIAVGAVVVNRLRSGRFAKTLDGVIREPGQFKCVEVGTIQTPAGSLSKRAAHLALLGKDPTFGALFFYNPQKTQTPDFWAKRQIVLVIGSHAFAK